MHPYERELLAPSFRLVLLRLKFSSALRHFLFYVSMKVEFWLDNYEARDEFAVLLQNTSGEFVFISERKNRKDICSRRLHKITIEIIRGPNEVDCFLFRSRSSANRSKMINFILISSSSNRPDVCRIRPDRHRKWGSIRWVNIEWVIYHDSETITRFLLESVINDYSQ